MKVRVFFDTAAEFNCVRIERPAVEGSYAALPVTAIDVHEVDESQIPADRTFRNAWKADLSVDMIQAREIKRQQLRDLRKPILAALDAAYLRADERGDSLEKQRIAAQKQALRDVTADPAIEAAQTPEELKALWPEILKPKEE